MPPAFRSRRPGAIVLIVAAALVLIALVAPSAVAGGLGRLVANLWVSTIAAIAGLLGGFMGR